MLNISGYDSLELIHEGRTNIVCRGRRQTDHLGVVLKMLRSTTPTAGEIALLYHAFEVTKDLDLPGVIKSYEVVDDRNRYALVQEDMHGVSLTDYMQQHPINDLTTFFKIARQMLTILSDIHRIHIIHKDIKPGNFVINPDTLMVKLTDFAFAAKLEHESQDAVTPSRLEGTLAYMAPEQTGRMNMNIDYRSDFYALGVSFFEMLTHRQPFISTDPLEIVHCHLAIIAPAASSLNPNIPESLSELIQKLMAKDPSNRYRSATGVLSDLERMAEGAHAPFPLGQNDVHDRLDLSQKLYGREAETRALLKAYERVAMGGAEALMVCGYSGIGKTMLINEVHRPMVKDRGYFISGKFDQLQRNTPLTAITQAFNQLAQHILSEPEERFEVIKADILNVMGDVGQVMVDLAPALESVLGKQAPLQALPARETQNRMMTFFRRFLSVIATEQHPLVLFIDDLQWADSGSLKLLEFVLTDDTLRHLLLIGAYRDNEVDTYHPFQKFLDTMQQQGRPIQTLHLGPLDVHHYSSMIGDSFELAPITAQPLAELIHKRTEGNPFFFKQIITSIYQQKLLHFDYERRQWTWDLEKVRELNITSNVVDLMISKLSALPVATQNLLKVAACVGNRFTIDMLEVVSGQTAEAIGKSLWPALQSELVITLSQGYKRIDAMRQESLASVLSKEITYKFVHDRVQQAVYQSIPDDERRQTHVKIARSIRSKEASALRREHLFIVADHFNEAHALLETSEREDVAEINYQAGVVALSSNAYQPMCSYMKAGLELSGEDWWIHHYTLMFNLSRGYSQSLYLVGELEAAGQLTEALLQRAQSTQDKVSIYRIQCIHLVSIGQSADALATGIKALDLLGVRLPQSPSRVTLLLKIAELKWAIRGKRVEALDEELKELTDPNIISAFEILSEIVYLVYWAPGNMYLYLGFEVMLLMLRHGIPTSGALWMTIYAMSVVHVFRNVDEAFVLWECAERLMNRYNNKYTSATALTFRAYWLHHLRHPFKDAPIYFNRAIEDAYESGNLIAVIVNSSTEFTTLMTEGRCPVPQIQERLPKLLDYARKIHLADYERQLTHRISFLATLQDSSNFDLAKESLADVLQGKNPFHQLIALATMATCAYYLERYAEAYDYHISWHVRERRIRYAVSTFTFEAIGALTIFRLIKDKGILQRQPALRRLHQIRRSLQRAAKWCPQNYRHQFLVIEATLQQLKGNTIRALQYYHRAIENAQQGDLHLWTATCCELAGEMLYEQEFPEYGMESIRKAYYYYERYGMKVKTESLRRRYPECFAEQAVIPTPERYLASESPTSAVTTSSTLDYMSVIKAGQAISSEIVLDKLFQQILHVLMENAGAEKAVFLEKHADGWTVAASLVLDKFQVSKAALHDTDELPQSVVAYSVRTQSPFIAADLRQEDRFRTDAYVQRVQPKSAFCLPILHHNELTGLVYLENNQSVGCFTAARVTVLQTLASQIAISLENSHHMAHLEQLFAKTERFVPKAFLNMLNRPNIEEVKLGDSVKKDITIIFNDIRSFTTLIEGRSPEAAFAFVNRYWKFMAPIIRKHGGYIDQYQGDAILAIFPNQPLDAVRCSIAMMQELSVFNEAQKQANDVPINMGIGISTGPAMLGVIGEPERQVSGVISDVANTAARVEGLNKTYGSSILMSGLTARALKGQLGFLVRKVDQVRLKGKVAVTELFEVVGWADQLKDISCEEYIATFDSAFKQYMEGAFEQARTSLQSCLVNYPGDKVAALLIERCDNFLAAGSPPDWDGTFTLTSK